MLEKQRSAESGRDGKHSPTLLLSTILEGALLHAFAAQSAVAVCRIDANVACERAEIQRLQRTEQTKRKEIDVRRQRTRTAVARGEVALLAALHGALQLGVRVRATDKRLRAELRRKQALIAQQLRHQHALAQ